MRGPDAMAAHLELVRQVAAADVKSKGRAGIPPELSAPVLAAIALQARQRAAEAASAASAQALSEQAAQAAATPLPVPSRREVALRSCKDMAIQAGDSLDTETRPEPPVLPALAVEPEREVEVDEDGSPMPVAEHRFVAVEPPAAMLELRQLLEEATSLGPELPKHPQLAGDVTRLLAELESAVLEHVVEDAAAAAAELASRKEAAGAGADRFDTAQDFVDSCRQFEDELCKKYGVAKR
ncbi:unnamed protein product [Effrenium voratum]|uniref:Uncharacterized protein n=1 Tax=Effrenium voratum TaxID=2562239 RepID=A0AA36J9J0_9DINO|nr:unnamed protein product [Effrenium voratum]CAJ1454818.1 unnamed protein product [Effrenium voratum]